MVILFQFDQTAPTCDQILTHNFTNRFRKQFYGKYSFLKCERHPFLLQISTQSQRTFIKIILLSSFIKIICFYVSWKNIRSSKLKNTFPFCARYQFILRGNQTSIKFSNIIPISNCFNNNRLADFPFVLRTMMLHRLHRGLHLQMKFFQQYSDPDFLSFTVPLLILMSFHNSTMIYLEKDYAERVYFVTNGLVSLVTGLDTSLSVEEQFAWVSEHKQESQHQSGKAVQSDTFGLADVLFDNPRAESAVEH